MLSPPDDDTPVGKLAAFWRWLTVGAVAVVLFFQMSVHLPQSAKLPGVLLIALGAAAGWGLGRWGVYMNVAPTRAVAISTWLCLGLGAVSATGKTYRDGLQIMRAQKQWQEFLPDPITDHLRNYVNRQSENESPEDAERRRQMRAELERGDALHRQRQEYLTFSGFLANRIPKEWGRWQPPWPAVFWGTEVLVGSTLGAWITLNTLRTASSGMVRGNSDSARDLSSA
jgi:hypothetical protein